MHSLHQKQRMGRVPETACCILMACKYQLIKNKLFMGIIYQQSCFCPGNLALRLQSGAGARPCSPPHAPFSVRRDEDAFGPVEGGCIVSGGWMLCSPHRETVIFMANTVRFKLHIGVLGSVCQKSGIGKRIFAPHACEAIASIPRALLFILEGCGLICVTNCVCVRG